MLTGLESEQGNDKHPKWRCPMGCHDSITGSQLLQRIHYVEEEKLQISFSIIRDGCQSLQIDVYTYLGEDFEKIH